MSLPLFISGGYFGIAPLKSYGLNKYGYYSLVLFIPLIISMFANIFLSPCPLSSEILFYFVISIPAFFIGFVIGDAVTKFTKKVNRTLFIIIFVLLLLISLIEFYFLPQIYFFNPVFGYFPGTIYDEHIQLSFQLIIYRILNVLFFAGLFLFLRKKDKIEFKVVVFIILLMVLWFGCLKQSLGLITTENRIENQLSEKIETEHFEIFFDKTIGYNINSLKRLHEFYYKIIYDQLELKNEYKIKSYIFINRRQKKELFGSENADVAKPWLRQIYLNGENFQKTLKHELVHILAGEFGNAPFKVAGYINPSLIEGVAMAIENDYAGYNIDYLVKLAEQHGYQISISELFEGLNFFTNTSSASYLFSGSFVKYLIENYGIDKVKMFYKSGNFSQIFNKPIDHYENEFKNYIGKLDYPENPAAAQLYFGRKPLIKKICPRYAAKMLHKADEYFREGHYNEALKYYEDVFSYSGNYSSLNGMVFCNVQLEEYENALNLLIKNIKSFKNTSYFYILELRTSDIAILNSEVNLARSYLDSLIIQNPSTDYLVEAELRKLLLDFGIDIYKNFVISNAEERFNLLYDNWSDSNYTLLMNKLNQYSTGETKNQELLEMIDVSKIDTTNIGVITSLELSSSAFRLNMLTEAKKFIEYAIKHNKEKQIEPRLFEQYKLIQWSMQN
ncbi:MAG: hypothetical protein U5K00_02965 [Melioribacteraceae bacterium]|nr:hypothetical protein [Melioribacteraceae bacterium]